MFHTFVMNRLFNKVAFFHLPFQQTRMQSIKPCPEARYTNVFNGLATIVRKEGPLRMVRGLHVVAAGAGPAHAVYFACYERLKAMLSTHPGRNPLANGEDIVCFCPNFVV